MSQYWPNKLIVSTLSSVLTISGCSNTSELVVTHNKVNSTPTFAVQSKHNETSQRNAQSKRKYYKNVGQYQRILNATTDFKWLADDGLYIHSQRDVLAVNAAKKPFRDIFIAARYIVDFEYEQSFLAQLITLSENDGESHYQVWLNDKFIIEVTNPKSDRNYDEVIHELGMLALKPNDVITVKSMAVTNGQIQEGNGTAYARGRWRGIVLK